MAYEKLAYHIYSKLWLNIYTHLLIRIKGQVKITSPFTDKTSDFSAVFSKFIG